MTAPRPSWGEAESALVAELARGAVIKASGQRGVRIARVNLRGESAAVQVLMLDGQQALVWLEHRFGRWRVTGIDEAR